MRILFLSQYYPPEIGATQNRVFEMCTNIQNLGHSITVITEVPNHPSGIIKSEYKKNPFHTCNEDGIEVIRVWVRASTKKNFSNRIMFYISYMLNAILAGTFFARNNYDLIYATSPPLFVGGAALALSFLKNTPFVFEVRDLWPESAVALEELKHPAFISMAKKLEEFCYKKSKKIIVVTSGIYSRLVSRGLPAEKIILIPNGSNVDHFYYKPDAREKIRNQLQINKKFVLIYAGIFGLAQGLDTIIKTAELVKDYEDIHFLFVGEGPKKTELQSMITKLKLSNTTILPEQPYDLIPDYLSAADAAIIPLKNVDLFKGALPSKLFDAWACERPVLLCIDGEAHTILDNAKGGLFVPPEDPVKLSKSILQLRNSNEEERKQMGINGRIFTENNYSRRKLATLLESELVRLIKPNM